MKNENSTYKFWNTNWNFSVIKCAQNEYQMLKKIFHQALDKHWINSIWKKRLGKGYLRKNTENHYFNFWYTKLWFPTARSSNQKFAWPWATIMLESFEISSRWKRSQKVLRENSVKEIRNEIFRNFSLIFAMFRLWKVPKGKKNTTHQT